MLTPEEQGKDAAAVALGRLGGEARTAKKCQQSVEAKSQNTRHALDIPNRSDRVAGADKQEFPPLLPAGFHRMDLAGLRRLAVDRFTHSFTRGSVMTNLENIVARINQSAIPGTIWIDGSFVTEKLNPEDVDVLLVVDAATYRTLTPQQRAFFSGFQATSLFATHKCDNYAAVIDPARSDGEWLLGYWLRQFGFSRSDEMKGIVTIGLPFLVMP